MAAAGINVPLTLELQADIKAHAVQRNLKPLEQIKNIVAVASGKGGVGKSTVAVNLALAWAAQGARVGDIGCRHLWAEPAVDAGPRGSATRLDRRQAPPAVESHGVGAMSIGFLVDAEQPMVWRGPMVTQALTQLLSETHWGELDYLVVDMPPGTGDIQLTLAQRVPVAGAVIVTTPQDIALADARKGLKMFEKVSVPVLGHRREHERACVHRTADIPSTSSAPAVAREWPQQYGVKLLGELPLDAHIREEADGGRPTRGGRPRTRRGRRLISRWPGAPRPRWRSVLATAAAYSRRS